MPRLTRRRLLAAGGAGAAASALAACGTSEPESERSAEGDAGLLADAALAEKGLQASAETASGKLEGEEAALAAAIAGSSTSRAAAVSDLLEAAGGEEPGVGGSGGDTLAAVADAAAGSITAYREAAALLSTPELREAILEHVTQTAAELATVRGLIGEEPSPFAFVTGGSEEPYEDTDFDPTEDS